MTQLLKGRLKTKNIRKIDHEFKRKQEKVDGRVGERKGKGEMK